MRLKTLISQYFLMLVVVIASGCSRSSDDFLQAGRTDAKNLKYDQAIKNFNRAIELDSNNAQAYLERAFMACEIKNPVLLETDLSKYIELTKKPLAIAYTGRALSHMLAQTNTGESLADCDKAIAIDPSNIQGYAFKKQLLIQQGDTVQLKRFLNSLDDSTRSRLLQNNNNNKCRLTRRSS
ncbi:MAG: tetratricopeptide repeat protein [Ignavibacteriales bacterium]|nr:tetratricopeptide repeat protein [Ignavibacteriales bacterium]